MQRRSLIETTATLGLGALAGCALPGAAQSGPKTPFTVPDTFVPIVGSELMFPVRRIYCIGRNYAAHAREMGSDPTREPPFFFQKPTDAIQSSNWLPRCTRAGATSRPRRHWTASTPTRWAWT
jgi:fumarylpyruvate hydrolase